MSRLPARHRSRHRPRWAARGRKRHARARPRAPNAPPMPSAPPFAGASARRQARQLQHLPFRARPLHRSHAASILLLRFHRRNTLSFRSTLDRSHGDCSRSAARPTDRLIFSPRFFFLFSSASAHSIEWMRPMGSHRSCTRSRLMPVEVRLPVGRRDHTQAVQRSAPPRQCSAPHNGFSPEASVGRSVRSVALVQTGTPRSTDSEQALPCGESTPRHGGFIDRHRLFAHDSPPLPHVRRSVSPPQRCLCARHANGTSHAPADSTFPFPVSAAPGAAEPLHPSFFLSFPCPKSFSRGCC